MSFAAAICSIVSDGIATGRWQTYAVAVYVQAMRKKLSIFALVCCLMGIATGEARDAIHKGDVAVVPLRGEVAPSLLAFLRRAVKMADRVVHPKGAVLTLNSQEATERINGKPLLAEGVVDSMADLTKKAGLTGNVAAIEPTGFEQIAFWITALAPLLLLGGILGAYLEFKIPGVTWPGVISAICFALFFLGHYLAGLAGWEVVAMFILGMILVLIEILFFAHSTIVFGVVGVFLMLASLLWTMIDRYPGQNFFPTGKMLAMPLLNMFIAIVGSFIIIALLARYLPRTSIYRRFALMDSNPPGPSLAGVPRQFTTALALTPGMQGTSVTVLRPSGTARFADHVVDVVTEGE